MSFSVFLSENIKTSKYTRTELIAKLNLYHTEFKNLDSVTLSRWCTKKTTPTLRKQILLCLFFDRDLISFIKQGQYEINHSFKTTKKKHNDFMLDIEKSYTNISYYYTEEDKKNYQVIINTAQEHKKKFKVFYENFHICMKFHAFLIENNVRIDTITIEEIINNKISSHESFAYFKSTEAYLFCKFFNIKKHPSQFWFSKPGYQKSKQSLEVTSALFTHIILLSKKYDIYTLIRGDVAYLNAQALGYVQIGTTYIEKKHKIYLCYGNIIDILSNPYVIYKLNRLYNKYDLDKYINNHDIETYMRS
ncbi:hypothetical protein EQ875_01516 [Photobacterium damselae subsp. damselae]|uniref:hypothetical protein n=1 Tax=Photobacterium damselae TaxID=38293 RepID=UPI00109BDE31|nr:hypothetical protein [Photobacterium damselae]TGZ35237.1 hypothetical protein EQ875_01516 [Photobacterium damselae subsp. damselae]